MDERRIVVVALEGMFGSSVALTVDVLETASALSRRGEGGVSLSHVIAGAAGGEVVGLSGGLSVQTTCGFDEITSADVVVVPGLGAWAPEVLAERLGRDDAVAAAAFVRRMRALGATAAASCASVFVLAEAGVLGCGPVTTTWWLADMLRSRHPELEVDPDRVVTFGPRVLCAGAAMAQADLMQALVERICGEDVAADVSRYLLLERRDLQPRYALSGVHAERHPDVGRARDWVAAHIGERFTVGDLARGLGMSARTLARRLEDGVGESPSRFVQGLRAERAAFLLQTTDASVEQIAVSVGYDDASSLRRATRARFGRTPHQLRQP